MARARILTAGVVVVRESPDGLRFLLLRAFRNWDCPKGVVERGERPLDAAVREVAEETGIADLRFDWGREFHETAPYSGNKVARYYLARTATRTVELGVNPELGRAEHHEYRWCSFDDAIELVVPRVQSALAWAAGKLMAGQSSRMAEVPRRK